MSTTVDLSARSEPTSTGRTNSTRSIATSCGAAPPKEKACPQQTGRDLRFVLDSYLRFQVQFGRPRLPTHSSTCSVAFQNTLGRTLESLETRLRHNSQTSSSYALEKAVAYASSSARRISTPPKTYARRVQRESESLRARFSRHVRVRDDDDPNARRPWFLKQAPITTHTPNALSRTRA